MAWQRRALRQAATAGLQDLRMAGGHQSATKRTRLQAETGSVISWRDVLVDSAGASATMAPVIDKGRRNDWCRRHPVTLLLSRGPCFGPQLARPEGRGSFVERLRVGELVQRHIKAGSFSGAVTLVARNGRIVHHEAYGLMDLEAKKPMVKDGIFRIMSMTKPVIGVSILMMMEEGKVRLQDPISKFIPEWKDMTVAVALPAAPGRGGAPAAAAGGGRGRGDAPRYYTVPVEREVQIRDLLTHTGGLVSGPMSQYANRAVAAGPKDTLADYVPRLGKVPLEFQPGTRWAYSATAAFDVLSRVVEIVSGMPIDRFVKTRLFDPLQMKDTTIADGQRVS
jgi:CubicO group peptidase (beta-lactamase class C family)